MLISDPNINSLMIGLLANGITALIAHIGCSTKRLLDGSPEPLQSFESIIQSALEKESESIQWNGHGRLEIVCLFLLTPEVEEIVRQVFSSNILGQNSMKIPQIQEEFTKLFSLYLGLNYTEVKDDAEQLFNAVCTGCEIAFQEAINANILSAHEIKSNLRFRLLYDEINNIERNIEFFKSLQVTDIKDIYDFEKKYRQQLSDRHKYITPPDFDRTKKVPINDLYVTPNFEIITKKAKENPSHIDLTRLIKRSYRIVVLGNPGAGKSTLSQKLCFDLSSEYDKKIFAGRMVTPVLVVLRDFGANKKASKCSILQYIESIANSKYQVSPPKGAFEYLLLNGRMIVIFDGLDELLDTTYRQEISGDIESFCNLYPAVPIIVTSREVGYEQAPLDDERFQSFRISSFTNEQVKEYLIKWFNLDTELTPEQRVKKVSNFLGESEIVPDLRSNPLMLALMCNIYRGENYIPRNRPDVYEKCSIMLFERWDKSRNISSPLPFEHHILPAMKYLAHWIYSNESLQAGVEEEQLVFMATKYLHERRYEDKDEAEAAAREFVSFCKGRAWVFTDTGTTREGESLYQFTHRTFLEYFTASYLVRNNETAESLYKTLIPHISKREWDVVAQLAFQLMSKASETAGDQLLTYLSQFEQEKNLKRRANVLSFASRCLEFIIPSPKVTRKVTEICFNQIMDSEIVDIVNKIDDYGLEIVGPLFVSARENREAISDTIEKILISAFENKDKNMSVKGAEITFQLLMAIFILSDTPNSQETIQYWSNLSDRIIELYTAKLSSLAIENASISFHMYKKRLLTIEKAISYHGPSIIFDQIPYGPFFIHGAKYSPVWMSILLSCFEVRAYDSLESSIREITEDLSQIGNMLIQFNTPWVEKFNLSHFHLQRFLTSQNNPSNEQKIKDQNAIFGAFLLLATCVEMMPERREIWPKINADSLIPFRDIICSLKARFEDVSDNIIENELDSVGFTEIQKEFIQKWIRKDIDFVYGGAQEEHVCETEDDDDFIQVSDFPSDEE